MAAQWADRLRRHPLCWSAYPVARALRATTPLSFRVPKAPSALIARFVRDTAKRQSLDIRKSPSLARSRMRHSVWQQVLLFGVMMLIGA